MKYTEFEGIICHLGKEYDVDQNNNNYIYVIYKGTPILDVDTSNPFILETHPLNEFNACPKKLEIWKEASLLAATPISEREEEKKYNVIIGNDDTIIPYTAWAKDIDMKSYLFYSTNAEKLREDSYLQFTDSEFKDLIKYIKTLPDGEFQVKVAEHGKRIVEE